MVLALRGIMRMMGPPAMRKKREEAPLEGFIPFFSFFPRGFRVPRGN